MSFSDHIIWSLSLAMMHTIQWNYFWHMLPNGSKQAASSVTRLAVNTSQHFTTRSVPQYLEILAGWHWTWENTDFVLCCECICLNWFIPGASNCKKQQQQHPNHQWTIKVWACTSLLCSKSVWNTVKWSGNKVVESCGGRMWTEPLQIADWVYTIFSVLLYEKFTASPYTIESKEQAVIEYFPLMG